MRPQAEDEQLQELIEAAYRQALKKFEQEVDKGQRDPLAEIVIYRRRRRDYETLLRLGKVPDEAGELAARLLQTRDLQPASRQAFEMDVTRLLIRLYTAFIARAEKDSGDGSGESTQGSR